MVITHIKVNHCCGTSLVYKLWVAGTNKVFLTRTQRPFAYPDVLQIPRINWMATSYSLQNLRTEQKVISVTLVVTI